MRKLLIILDDELDDWLGKQTNQNEVVRSALRVYKGDYTPNTLEGLRASYKIVIGLLKDMDSKIDYLDRRIK